MITKRSSSSPRRREARASWSASVSAGAFVALAVTGCADGPSQAAAELLATGEQDPTPAAQLGGTIIGHADASASVASAETKALFASGECDDVYEFRFFGEGGPGTPYLVQPGGEYQPSLEFDAPWGDEPLQAIRVKPLIDNKKVTHHYLLFAGGYSLLDIWGPGRVEASLPPDVGFNLSHGPRAIRFNMHYYNLTGTKPEPDRSGVAVCVVRGAKMRMHTASVAMFPAMSSPMVPANAKGHKVTASCKATVKEPVTLLSIWPHAHKLTRETSLIVTKADGRVVTLHNGPFAFEEQEAYPLNPPYVVENGDTFTTTCTYDNDTNKNIFFGENTDNEMCFSFAVSYPMNALSCGFGAGLPSGFNPFGDGGIPPGLGRFRDGGLPPGLGAFFDGGIPPGLRPGVAPAAAP